MIYGSGMRNISAGAVIAGAYFPAETLFPVMIGTLFQQILAAFYGSMMRRIQTGQQERRRSMEFQHELIIPNEGFPFKLFLLKEETEIM